MSINSELQTLTEQVKGTVLRRGDAQFESELEGFQTSLHHRPAVIVAAQVAEDVQAAVKFAAARELPVAVQATGHGVTVAPEGSVLINTSRMARITVDPKARTVYVEAGVRWENVVKETQPHHLAPLSGSAPHVGAVGYTLGGGTALLARTYGYAVDYVRSIDVVTADGTLRQVTAQSDPDLFWALRGGRDNFGIVTGLELELLPVGQVYAGGLIFDVRYAAEAFERFRSWTAEAPDELTASIGMVAYPPIPAIPEPIRGKHVVHLRFAYTGSPQDGEKLVAPLREIGPTIVDDVKEMPYSETGSVYNDPAFPHGFFGNNVLLRALDEEALKTVVELTGPNAELPCIVDLRQLGGALAGQPKVPSAVANRDAQYILRILSPVTDDLRPAAIRQVHQRIFDTVAPWTLGRSLNFIYGESGPSEYVHDIYPPEMYQRLVEIKTEYDPGNLFRSNQNIPPA